jgi:Putative phage abortive infection protein
MTFLKKHYSIIIVVLMILFAIICGAYVYRAYDNSFNHQIIPIAVNSKESATTLRAEWGQLGDFFGGTLNPIFGFLSFIGLLLTLVIQIKSLDKSSEELELSREELAKSSSALASQNKAIELQSFEQTFFSWLSTYRELLNSLHNSRNPGEILKGREALYFLYNTNLNSRWIYSSMCGSNSDELRPEFNNSYDYEFVRLSDYKKIEIIAENKQDLVSNNIHQIWCRLYQKEEYQLDSLFRTAYKLINWIDSLPTERLDNKQKWLYISIFRSQLSWVEMVFFYYNGLTGSGKKFKLLIDKYALFDNLTFDSDIGIKVMNKYFDIENNYAKSAFNSDIARDKFSLIKSS